MKFLVFKNYDFDGPIYRNRNYKLLGKNVGVNMRDLRFSSGFLNMTTNTQITKEKIYKSDFIKIKNLCVSKDTIKIVRYPSSNIFS